MSDVSSKRGGGEPAGSAEGEGTAPSAPGASTAAPAGSAASEAAARAATEALEPGEPAVALVPEPDALGAEPDAPPTRKLFIQIGLLMVILVGVLFGLWEIFELDSEREVYQKELSRPNRELLELLARDEGRLARYELLDPKLGVYQLPIDRAMELLLAEPARLAPIPVCRGAAQVGQSCGAAATDPSAAAPGLVKPAAAGPASRPRASRPRAEARP